jgi:hypothetical protein
MLRMGLCRTCGRLTRHDGGKAVPAKTPRRGAGLLPNFVGVECLLPLISLFGYTYFDCIDADFDLF